MDIFGITIAAAIASVAWIYQRAWERQERRTARYQEIIDRLPAFTTGQLDPTKMNEALREIHRLWLFAPDDVVEPCERVIDIAEGLDKDPKQLAVGRCILRMRRDATFSAALFPRF